MRDFDQMGLVVDWVDACRKGDLAMLLDLYADDAELECTCNGTHLYRGRRELETYWGPKLSAFSSAGFGLEEIHPAQNGIDLEYSVAGALRIRAYVSLQRGRQDPQHAMRAGAAGHARLRRVLTGDRVADFVPSGRRQRT